MVSKTREKLVEVARQLFLKKGVENTTMNDIAAASEKGRRTIYTYFKNKKEIYNAVIEQHSEDLVKGLREVAKQDISPEVKLEQYLTLRFQVMESLSTKNERYRYFFLRDNRRLNRVHKLALTKEREMLREMMSEGVASGIFDPEQAARLPYVEAMLAHAIDLDDAENREHEIAELSIVRENVVKFIISGMLKKNQSE